MNELEIEEYKEIALRLESCKENESWVSILVGSKFTPSGFVQSLKNGWLTIGDERRNVMVHVRSIKTLTIMDN
tara:strand:- start:4371 stop:4589 length:219 start_codon:yes stop_codon:yes gene_type:complete